MFSVIFCIRIILNSVYFALRVILLYTLYYGSGSQVLFIAASVHVYESARDWKTTDHKLTSLGVVCYGEH